MTLFKTVMGKKRPAIFNFCVCLIVAMLMSRPLGNLQYDPMPQSPFHSTAIMCMLGCNNKDSKDSNADEPASLFQPAGFEAVSLIVGPLCL